MAKKLPGHGRIRPPETERGAAILVVLAVLAILSILVLGFVSSMSTDLKSSRSVEVGYQTKLIAHGALSHSIELLRSNIPDPAPITETPETAPARLWVTNPGRLTIITGGGSSSIVPLHSGVPPDPEEDALFEARSVDLNRPLAGKTIGPISSPEESLADERPEMRVAWLPVLKDPSKPASEDNRMTGRYAFWIDDESSKLNVSVALGKPDIDEDDISPDGFPNWKNQLVNGAVTPQFVITGKDEADLGIGPRVSIGHPWSINLDTLFEDGELPVDLVRLHHESHVHGFQRYPDAILRFVDLPETEKRDWYHRNRWNMTFYSRSPEFNAFGLSRLFTLHEPATLPGGPAYQMPFSKNGTTHFQALFGFPSVSDFDSLISESNAGPSEEELRIHELTLDSGRTLMQYLKRQWPGQPGTLFSKYGGEESRQIVLNTLMMSRFATARTFGAGDYSRLVGSLNYRGEPKPGSTVPDQDFWYLNDDFEVDFDLEPMLPQTPGPHINEIKFVVKKHFWEFDDRRAVSLLYHYQVEYYLHPEHPLGPSFPSDNRIPFPVKVDYLKLKANAHSQEFDDDNWNEGNLEKLQTDPDEPVLFKSDRSYPSVSSDTFLLGLGDDLIEVPDGMPTEAQLKRSKIFFPSNESDVNITFKINLRLGLGLSGRADGVKEMVPLGTEPPSEDEEDSGDTLEGEITLDLSDPDPKNIASWEVEDPRVGWDPDDWLLRVDEDSMGGPNTDQPRDHEASEYSTFKYVQLHDTGDEFEANTRFPSAGYLSMIHTGIRSREPWRTLSLQNNGGGAADWVLLDLLGATFPADLLGTEYSRSLPDHWMSLSYMNATAGKVNLNNKVYPDNEWFNPPERTKPLKAVFRYLRDDSFIDLLTEQILDYQSDGQVFETIGDLTEVASYSQGTTTWEKESLLRNLASCLTTQSNTFGIWGCAQTVAKSPNSTLYDELEKGDSVLGEKRFFALVERYVWPGRDGIPGNGHVDSSAMWDRLSESNEPARWPGLAPKPKLSGKFDVVDGPHSVTLDYPELLAEVPFESSSLAAADNPPHPVVKYRVLYFRYLDH